MAQVLDKQGLQHYANKMCNADNRKVGSKSLPTVLNDIDTAIDGFKTLFESEYGSALDMKLENNKNVFSVGTGTNVDKRSEIENSFTDVELGGNSLVNLFTTTQNFISAGSNIVRNGFVITLSNASGWSKIGNRLNLKPNTTYYAQITCENKSNNTCSSYIRFSHNINYSSGINIPQFPANSTTTQSSIFTTDDTGLVLLSVERGQGTNESIFYDIILLEGDWTNKPIPQYFEGMKSVGQDDVNGHKIEILSQNKNLFDKAKLFNSSYSFGIPTKSEGELVNVSISGNRYTSVNTGYFHKGCGGCIKVEKNKDYTLSIENVDVSWTETKSSCEIILLPLYKNEVPNKSASANSPLLERMKKTTSATTEKVSLTINSGNYDYIQFYIGGAWKDTMNGALTISYENPQLECSSSYTDYTEYSFDKKEISLNEPLRGLPNGVRDTIEKINGEWKIVRRCGSYTLTGAENELWKDKALSSVVEDVKGFEWVSNLPIVGREILCDNLAVEYEYTNHLYKAIRVYQPNSGIVIVVNKSDLSSMNVNGFRLWLQQNSPTIIYELETPIIEDIEPMTLQCWKNGTISIDEVLPVESTHTVALNKSAQIQKNIEELSILKNRVEVLEKQYNNSTLNQAYELELLRLDMQLDNII